MRLGPTIVRGTLWPTGEHFAATLWATSGRPGGDRILQVIYTDRGAYRTGLDVYELGPLLFDNGEHTLDVNFERYLDTQSRPRLL